jgi:hypothetical protein
MPIEITTWAFMAMKARRLLRQKDQSEDSEAIVCADSDARWLDKVSKLDYRLVHNAIKVIL